MKKFISSVVLLCAVMISSPASAEADWVWVYSDEYYAIWVDNNSIRRDRNYSGYVFRAFVRWDYSEAGRDQMIKIFLSKGVSLPKGYNNLSHRISLEYFKEESGIKRQATMILTTHDQNGNVISVHDISNYPPQWAIIPPDTLGELIFDTIRARVPN